MIIERTYRGFIVLVQVLPLALLALYLFLLTKPPENPHPGVASGTSIGFWYVFPLSVALGAFGLLAIVSAIAAYAAAMLTIVALLYGLRVWLPGVDIQLGALVVVLSVFSLLGFAFRWHEWGRDASPSATGGETVTPGERLALALSTVLVFGGLVYAYLFFFPLLNYARTSN